MQHQHQLKKPTRKGSHKMMTQAKLKRKSRLEKPAQKEEQDDNESIRTSKSSHLETCRCVGRQLRQISEQFSQDYQASIRSSSSSSSSLPVKVSQKVCVGGKYATIRLVSLVVLGAAFSCWLNELVRMKLN